MRLMKLALVVAASALLAGSAVAQQPGRQPGGFGGGGFGGGGLAGMIGQNKQLQEELKISKEQVQQLTEALAKVREDLKDETAKLRDRNTPQEDRAELTKKISDTNLKAVHAVLNSEQVKRLNQIQNQQAGIGMYAKEDVQKALKLSGDQKEKIKGINEDLQKGIRELFTAGPGGAGGRGGFDPEAIKKRQTMQKEAADAIAKVLDADQKAAVKDLTGAPFEMRFEGFGGGGPGGAGGAGGSGRGGPGGGFGAPSQPGQILSAGFQDQLKLTAEQKQQMEALQKEVDSKLAKILTEEQLKQLKERPQGFGGRGGAGGRGGPGGGRDNPPGGRP